MSVEPANNRVDRNVVVGSVRRFADDRSVTLHVDGSRNALVGAGMLALVPLACLLLGGWFCLASSPDTLGSLACFAVVGLAVFILPSAAVLPMIKRLLGTALSRVTLDADAAHLRLLAFGAAQPFCASWRRDEIRDVRAHTRGSGIYELHILLANERFVPLLFGVTRAELEFIERELRRALQMDARHGSVAAWWGDRPAEAPASENAGAVLDYAPEPKDRAAAERSAVRARVFIPPAGVGAVLRQRKWSILATLVLLAVVLLFQELAGGRPSRALWVCWAAVVLVTELPAFVECVRHRTVEVDAQRVTLTVRTPLLGDTVRVWPAEAVADIAAAGRMLELQLRDGRRQTMGVLATPADADALARSLRPASAAA